MRHHHHPLSLRQSSRPPPPTAIPRRYILSEGTLEQAATRTAMNMGGGSKTTGTPRPGNNTTPRPGNNTALPLHTEQLSHLPTPPSSFNSTTSSVHSYSYESCHRQDEGPSPNTKLTPKRVASLRASPVEQRQLLPQPSGTLRASHPPKQMADTPYLPRSPSLSPEPLGDELLFPTINFGSPRSSPHSSPRSSPERDLELHTSSRESSPESYRESPVPLPPSPKHSADAAGCSRSRSSSPLGTLRPPQIPLPPDTEGVYGPVLSGRGRGRGSAASSVASFDMLASYGSIPASAAASDKKELEKMVQQQGISHHRTYPQFERHLGYVFKPNTGLAKEITPSFIGTYATPRDRRMSESRTMGPPPLPQGGSKRSQTDPARRGTHSPVDSVSSLEFPFRRKREREVSEEPLQEEVDSSYDLRKIKMEDTMASDPTVSEQSGIPSYCEEFERDRKVQQWQYENACPSEHYLARRHLSPSGPPSESLSAAFRQELTSQVDGCLRRFKGPLVTISLISIISVFVGLIAFGSTMLFSPAPTTINPASQLPEQANTSSTSSSWGGVVDFATLMNIESAFERVVDSSAGGSELARSLKQSEMAVSDLSTVVRHSDLKCRTTLSARLARFADDARSNVDGLLQFATEVGGVLDQLLSVNQYTLRELHLIAETPSAITYLPYPLSLLFTDTPPHSRLIELFDTAASALETNLRLLIASGQHIASALDDLARQHKPIHDEIIREFSDIRKAQQTRGQKSTLSTLWARFGITRDNFRENEKLLGEIHTYQDKARGYVEVTLMELRRMVTELDGLRRRVAQPLLLAEVEGRKSRWKKMRRWVWGGGEVDVGAEIKAVEGAVEALLRKRSGREERMRQWNRLILERELKEVKGQVEE